MSDYPEIAGSKGGGASAEAAEKITATGLKASLERKVLSLFSERRPDWTPDEAARVLGHHVADIRPRFSELTVQRLDRYGFLVRPAYLRKTKRRRLSFRGNSQHVYERL